MNDSGKYQPLIECAPWCEDGDGHPGQAYGDGPAPCFGPEHHVEIVRQGDKLTVYATRDSAADATYVFLGLGEAFALLELSPTDAAALRDALTATLTATLTDLDA